MPPVMEPKNLSNINRYLLLTIGGLLIIIIALIGFKTNRWSALIYPLFVSSLLSAYYLKPEFKTSFLGFSLILLLSVLSILMTIFVFILAMEASPEGTEWLAWIFLCGLLAGCSIWTVRNTISSWTERTF